MKVRITETMLKLQIKTYLDIKNIFNYPLLQGIGSYRGLPDRVMHYKGEVCYLEVKTPKGKLSEYQEAFKAQCEASRTQYFIIRSLEDLMEIVG